MRAIGVGPAGSVPRASLVCWVACVFPAAMTERDVVLHGLLCYARLRRTHSPPQALQDAICDWGRAKISMARARAAQVRDSLQELDRLSSERWAREMQRAADAACEPGRPLSPTTAARARAKMRARAVVNRPVAAPLTRSSLDTLD